MRLAFWLLTIILATASAAQWSGEFDLASGTATVTVTGSSPLNISIPAGAAITGADYSNGTAVFNESFSYSFSTKDTLMTGQGGDAFLYAFQQPREYDYSLKVLLPPDHTIESSAPQAGYYTDGQRIGAEWTGNGSDAQFSMRYIRPGGPVIQFVETDIPIVDKTIFLPGIILAFLFGYFLAAGMGTALFQRIRQITAGMSHDEKNVVYLLRDGPVDQSDLQRKGGFSKAKLSRLLRGMEERRIIQKTPQGKKNLVSLK